MDAYSHPTARFRLQCIELALKAGTTGAEAVLQAADRIEAHVARPTSAMARPDRPHSAAEPFERAERELLGRVWTVAQADQLIALVRTGLRPTWVE